MLSVLQEKGRSQHGLDSGFMWQTWFCVDAFHPSVMLLEGQQRQSDVQAQPRGKVSPDVRSKCRKSLLMTRMMTSTRTFLPHVGLASCISKGNSKQETLHKELPDVDLPNGVGALSPSANEKENSKVSPKTHRKVPLYIWNT